VDLRSPVNAQVSKDLGRAQPRSGWVFTACPRGSHGD
jgi:hypothetical protein